MKLASSIYIILLVISFITTLAAMIFLPALVGYAIKGRDLSPWIVVFNLAWIFILILF